jgi:hypothetical protein
MLLSKNKQKYKKGRGKNSVYPIVLLATMKEDNMT